MAKFHYRDSPTPQQKAAFKPYLSEDEELILVAGFSQAYIRQEFLLFFFFPGIIFGLSGAILSWYLGIGAVWSVGTAFIMMLVVAIVKTIHLHHANRYILTTRRVMIKKGVFSVKLTAALYDKVTHIEVDQTFVDRVLLHHGDVIINTAGLSRNEIVLKYIDYPMEFKNLLERLINREREHYGIRSGPVSAVEGEIVDLGD